MLASLRQNLLLKAVSLLASVLLYGYVQAERDPTITRAMAASVRIVNPGSGQEVETPTSSVEVSVTGPKNIVERIKDNDVTALGDLNGKSVTEVTTLPVRLRFSADTLLPDMRKDLSFDPPVSSVRVTIFPQQNRRLPVSARFAKHPPAGYIYGPEEITPSFIRIAGRADRLARVSEVVANAAPPVSGANIEGDFTLSARDSDDNPIDGIVLDPGIVHVRVLLVEEPDSKELLVSPNFQGQPPPPYKIEGVTVTPGEVKITGRWGQLSHVSQLLTEEISLREMTESKTVDASLQLPANVAVQDKEGHTITHVTVHITVARLSPSPSGATSGLASPPATTTKP